MRAFAEFIVRWRYLVLAASLLVTVLLGLQLRHLNVIVDADELLPKEHPFVQVVEPLERRVAPGDPDRSGVEEVLQHVLGLGPVPAPVDLAAHLVVLDLPGAVFLERKSLPRHHLDRCRRGGAHVP